MFISFENRTTLSKVAETNQNWRNDERRIEGGSWVRFPARVGSILEDIFTLVLYLKTAFFLCLISFILLLFIYIKVGFFHFKEGGRCRSQTPQECFWEVGMA